MDPRFFKSLEWRCIGPHRGGRCVAVAGHPTEQGTFYFGACAGGVWKTTNAGSHWWNVSDGFFKTASVGALAVSDSDPSVLYVGTGEACIRSNVSHGDGVYRSDDGGHTWRNVGLAETRHISSLAIHPRDPDTAYVAALGHAWGTNPERGIYRTTNGGASWDLVLHKSERAGAAALSLDPTNPRILYAALWQGQRYPHAAISGGEESGIWRSTDGGTTWRDLTRAKGLPAGILGRIGIAASPARAGRVWALVEAEEGAMFRSDDFGETWDKASDKADLRRRPWYYMHVFADPNDANTVWVANLNLWRSLDAGNTFASIPTPHGDNHALWIDPRNSKRMIEGNDGGACISFDGAHSWSTLLNQPTAQFYHVTTDDQTPYHVYGSQQDNWAMRLPSAESEGAISWKDYVEPGGGESGYIAIGRRPPHLVFGGGIGTGPGHGRLIAWNPETRQKRNITVWPEVHGMGAGAESLKYRFQWTFPVEVSPHDDHTLYVCSNVVHRSTDDGGSWETISPDLTRNDPTKIESSGGPLTADNSGAEIYCTIFAFRESPHEAGVFWAGSDDGLVHLSRDAGTTWSNVTPPDLPEWALIGILEPSPHDTASAYLSATGYKSDDLRPYLYRTSNYGQTWTRITSGIPDTEFTRVIREDPNRRGLLYCGTEGGVYVSLDDGVNWQKLDANLPVVPIWDLVVHGTDLVAATHGRSFWILDDITPLHQLQDALPTAPHLFAPRDTLRFRVYGRAFDRNKPEFVNYKMTGPLTVGYRPVESPSGAKGEQFYDAGQNPPDGVVVHYWLPEAPADGITLTFLDSAGQDIRSYTNQDDKEKGPSAPADAGMNRFVWDLRYPPPTSVEKPRSTTKDEDTSDEGIPPRAIPGQYQVRLTVGSESFTQTFALLADPRLSATLDDRRATFELKLGIRDRLSELAEALNQIQRVREQVEAWLARSKDEGLQSAGTTLLDRLKEIDGELVNLNADKPRPGQNRLKEKLETLSAMIDESDDAPTHGAIELYAELRRVLDEQRRKLAEVVDEPIREFNGLVSSLGLSPVG